MERKFSFALLLTVQIIYQMPFCNGLVVYNKAGERIVYQHMIAAFGPQSANVTAPIVLAQPETLCTPGFNFVMLLLLGSVPRCRWELVLCFVLACVALNQAKSFSLLSIDWMYLDTSMSLVSLLFAAFVYWSGMFRFGVPSHWSYEAAAIIVTSRWKVSTLSIRLVCLI